ncbi:MAG: hypothetical protein IJC07_01000 [Clostridia bacterium]|nr:hypothetical protein [Clostridia bacterium]
MIIITILGIGSILFGLYAIKMAGATEYTVICFILGILLLIAGTWMPIFSIIYAFREHLMRAAIINIVITALSSVGIIFFIRWLKY